MSIEQEISTVLKLLPKLADATRVSCASVPDYMLEQWLADVKAISARAEKVETELAKHKWQPIETAPKDGTKVLLFAPAPWSSTEKIVLTGLFKNYWQADPNEATEHVPDAYKPTHWKSIDIPETQNDVVVE